MSEGIQIQPYVLAILICDTIITEEGTGKKTLVGVFGQVVALEYPAPHRFGIYVKLTDAQGPYQLHIEYVDVSNDRIIEERLDLGRIDVPSRLSAAEIVLTVTAPIPSPGAYEFRLYGNNAYLARASFEASRAEKPGRQAS